MADLSQMEQSNKADEGVWKEIEDASGTPLDIHLLLAGADSEAYQKELRRQQDKLLKKGRMKLSAEEAENNSVELLAACTLDWRNVEYNGDALECNRKNARWLYKNPRLSFIRDQVDEFIGDRANFLES